MWIVPVATLAAALGAVLGAAALAATLAAALGALDAVDELHAAMIAGMDTRPAAPTMPLRMVRRETVDWMGSAIALTPPLMLPDKIRQDQPDCPYPQRSCQGVAMPFVGHLFERVDFRRFRLQSFDQKG
jgi:hypothetical protein